ncbi:MAG: hypothetical protein U0791_20685 [Gemmataceae bacterium]
MILVDCSVLVDHFRKKDPKLAKQLVSLPIGICGSTRSETLAGARTAKERGSVTATINALQQAFTPETIWDALGDNLAILKSKGVNVPFPDVLLASIGIHHDLEVWARDQHFPLMQKHLPRLRLFQEPP